VEQPLPQTPKDQDCTKDGWCRVHQLPKNNRGWLQKLWASGPDDIFAAGGYGTIVHFDGKHWRAQENAAGHKTILRKVIEAQDKDG
jgi:photosystem II stability/assembly factor-like uncharacterized protein